MVEMFQQHKTKFEEVFTFSVPMLEDRRGGFTKYFSNLSRALLDDFAIREIFATTSKQNVLRGMHLQENQWQLITLLSGEILDVVLNLDKKSSEYKQSSSISLSWDGMNQILIRPGVAHGYAVLSESATIHYKSSIYYGDSTQIGVHWQSNEIVNHWPDQSWKLSERDSSFKLLKEMD